LVCHNFTSKSITKKAQDSFQRGPAVRFGVALAKDIDKKMNGRRARINKSDSISSLANGSGIR
jgi:hypothetical protein